MSGPPIFEEYEQQDDLKKLINKSKDSPFVPIGMAGFFIVAGMGAYNYRNRGKMSTSMYLMQLRVAAQGTVVGCLCLGLVYTMAQQYLFKKDSTLPEIMDTAQTPPTPTKY